MVSDSIACFNDVTCVDWLLASVQEGDATAPDDLYLQFNFDLTCFSRLVKSKSVKIREIGGESCHFMQRELNLFEIVANRSNPRTSEIIVKSKLNL